MPYGGTTPKQDKRIERCVKDLLKNKKFRKGQIHKTRKKSAIAICKASILKKDLKK